MKEPPKSQGSCKPAITLAITKKKEPRGSKTLSKYLQTRLLLPKKRAILDSDSEVSEDATYECDPNT